jgi:hypothetical protein
LAAGRQDAARTRSRDGCATEVHGKGWAAGDDSSNLSKIANKFPHLVMIADEENFQGLPAGAEQQPDLQSGPAFEHIISQPPDGNSRVKMRLAETIRERAQHLLDPGRIPAAKAVKRGEEARTEQDGGFSHASICF